LLHGLIMLQKKVEGETIKGSRWYSKEPNRPIPVPVLGPDLMDPRLYAQIREKYALEQEPVGEVEKAEGDELVEGGQQ
jgi:hypothetical protein